MRLRQAIFFLSFLLLLSGPIEASVSKNRHRGYHGADRSSCSSKTLSIRDTSKPLIMIDAGHGGSDEGAKVGSCIEKKLH